MESNGNQSSDDKGLEKHEILRGHDAYSKVFQNSILLSGSFLKAFVSLQNNELVLFDFSKSPPLSNHLKVGFIIAKKKIRKAVLRNRIKRLLKESYRLNKNQSEISHFNLNIIFSLTESGYLYFIKNPYTKQFLLNDEMKLLFVKIKNHFIKQ